jgi:hypothetical protein
LEGYKYKYKKREIIFEPQNPETTEMTKPSILPPTPEQIEDLRLAASKMSGYKRRRFIADIALKYCDGMPEKPTLYLAGDEIMADSFS